MKNAKEIKSRIRSIHDTRKITNAMYMIASAKMKRVKKQLDLTRPYFDALHSEVKDIFQTVEDMESRYFHPADRREVFDETYGVLVITADKGLAGSYNKSIIKETEKLISEHPDVKLFVVGEYGRRFFLRQQANVVKNFLYTAQNPTMDRARDISAMLLDLFNKGELDKIFVIYTDLEDSLTTKVMSTCLLPICPSRLISFTKNNIEEEVSTTFEFYPSIEEVLNNVVKNLFSGFIYSALVSSFCSEQSARMTAMNLANKNAEKILESLTLQYNQMRQAAITQEVMEVISGAKAQKRKGKKEVL
ncbi:MAG TPA: ATP synthase F1 subunit gamma [Clostridium sp.]|jgi:F-type H+-transporting ATPase subunit gamma|nr:ATP synthase F1 subunit gamma [Clostridium sp.]